MNFEDFGDLSSVLQQPGITVMKFCGLDEGVEGEMVIACHREAVGEISVELENGSFCPIPICQQHLDMIASQHEVENI